MAPAPADRWMAPALDPAGAPEADRGRSAALADGSNAPASGGPAPDDATLLDLLQRPEPACLLHPAQDVLDGVLYYGVPVGERLVCVTSRRQAYPADRLPPGVGLRHADPGPGTLSRSAAVAWLTGREAGAVAPALDALAAFFARHVVLREPRAAGWLAAWALGTWCYRAFRVYPYLSIRSAEKRCGKSRLLHLLARVGFNASPPTAHPTEAQLYRGAARTGGVQLFDEVEALRGDRPRFDALVSVLNVGFERGGVVSRLERRGGAWVDVASEVYAPRVLAGIAGLTETLEDRALPLFMVRRRGEPSGLVAVCGEPLPEGGDLEDRDAVDLAQAQEVGIGADHAVGAAGDGALEELVVGGITAEAEDDIGLDEPGPAPESDQHGAGLPRGNAELAQDVGPRGDGVDLGQDRLGDEQDELVGQPAS